MMPRTPALAIVVLALLGSCETSIPFEDRDPGIFEPLHVPPGASRAGDVDPFIGTANHGHTFPGPVHPWGMASPSPHTSVRDVATFFSQGPANAGYLSGEPKIHGFGLTHLSGTGCPDLGAPVIVPTVGPIRHRFDDYGSTYESEHAHAGYYATTLIDAAVHVELTATPRVGLFRFWFPNREQDANILIDVGQSLSFRRGAGEVRIVSEREIEGSVELGLFCGQQNQPTIHFVARFDHDAVESGTWVRNSTREATEARGFAGAFARFDTERGTPVHVAVGLSWVSIDNARNNLEREVGDLTRAKFDELHEIAAQRWHDTLDRIRVEGPDAGARTRFTTALYHALVSPSISSDVNGEYRRADDTVGQSEDERYTIFSMWDTFRTVHPLLSLVYPETQLAMLRTLTALTEEMGAPPKWELISEEVNMMVGDPLAIIVADSMARGIRDFDLESLYPYLARSASDPAHRPGLSSYLELGYVPMEEATEVWGPVSTTLEYALADDALARLATELGRTEEAEEFRTRSRSYRTLFDPATGLFRPRQADGSFTEPFDPDALEGSAIQRGAGGPGFVEGSAWTYAFFAPHDIEGLAELHGGENDLFTHLESFFDTGRFVMWNEPDMSYPYLFAHLPNGARRTQEIVRDAMDRHYVDGPAGLPGNDDTGTLSAWYVFSAMGFYPDIPGVARYALGSPMFERIEIAVGPESDSPRFVIVAQGNSPEKVHYSEATLDGAPLETPFLDHADMVDGGVLTLTME